MSTLRAEPWVLFAALGAIGVLGAAGCSKTGIAGELQIFKDGGRAVSEFIDLDASALGAQKCQAGTIDKIATLLCEYRSADAAAQGQTAAAGWFGQTSTALVLRKNQLLLGLADRNHSDQNGKSMLAISKIFRGIGKR